MWMKSLSAIGATSLRRFCAWLLLLNGLAGILVPLAGQLMRGNVVDPTHLFGIVPVLGVVAGVLALRGFTIGFAAGIGFYAIQSASYFSSQFNFTYKSGLSLASVHVLERGVLVVNWAAIALGALCAVVLWQLLLRSPDVPTAGN